MEIYIIDIWLEKIRRGWSLDDVPNEEIREAIVTRQSDLKQVLSGKKGLIDL